MSNKRSNRNNKKVLKALKNKRLRAHSGKHVNKGKGKWEPHNPNSGWHDLLPDDFPSTPPDDADSTPTAVKTTTTNPAGPESGTVTTTQDKNTATGATEQPRVAIDPAPAFTPTSVTVEPLNTGEVTADSSDAAKLKAGISTTTQAINQQTATDTSQIKGARAVKGAFAQMNEVLEEAKQAQTEAREAGLPFEFTPTVQRMFDNPEIVKAGMESGDASLLGSFISDPAMDRSRQLQIEKQRQDVDTGTFKSDLREEMGGVAGEAERQNQERQLRTLSALGLYNARMSVGSGGGGSGKTQTSRNKNKTLQTICRQSGCAYLYDSGRSGCKQH